MSGYAIRLSLALAFGVLSSGTAAAQVYGPPAPEQRDFAGDDHPAIPAPLNRAVQLAIDGHPSVGAAHAAVRAAHAELRGARWLRFPNLSVEALAVTRGSDVSSQDGLALNAMVEQPIWAGGRLGAEIARARANWMSAQDRERYAAQEIADAVVEAYYDLSLALDRRAILTDSLAENVVLIQSIRRRVDQEIAPRSDLVLGRSRAAQVELDLATAREAELRARARLTELTGNAAFERASGDDAPQSGLPGLLPPEGAATDAAIACSPELAALDHAARSADAERRMARGALFPQIAGQLSHNEITGTRAALVVRAQTGNGLSQISAIDGAAARMQQIVFQRAEAERAIREAVSVDYARLRSAVDRLDSGAAAASSAAEITESYKRQYIAGRRNWLDVMNAVREAASARLSHAEAANTAMRSAARILLNSCQWRPGPASTTGDFDA